MPLPRTYKEIEEMVRRKVLTTEMARKIVRKAGFRPGTIEDTSGVRISAIPILDVPGTRGAGPEDCPLLAAVMFCGIGRNFVVTTSGLMYGWGRDLKQFGIQGGPTTYTSPTRMHSEIPNAKMFAAGQESAPDTPASTFCLTEDGRIFGSGFVPSFNPPPESFLWEQVPLTSLQTLPNTAVPWTDVVEVSATGSVQINSNGPKYILRSDGSVWGRGDFMPGLAGDPEAYEGLPEGTQNTINTLGSWTKLSQTKLGGAVVSIIANGDMLVFLRADGVVRTWSYGHANPITVANAPANIVKMARGGSSVNVLTGSGEIWSAGRNNFGQAGILASSNTAALTALDNHLGTTSAAFRKTIGDGYTDVGAVSSATFAVKDGRLWSWGQGGVFSARGASAGIWGAPIEVVDPDISDVQTLNHGNSTNGMYVSASRGVYIWGNNTNGSLGQGSLSDPASGIPIPLADPDCVGSPVPNPPWQATSCSLGTPGSHLSTLTESERQEFWADAFAAEQGEQAGKDDMREWVTRFIGEGPIVQERIMPLLGYDYDGEVSTITLDADGACRIEVDVAPPDNGFWEHYQSGDERFSDTPNFGIGGGVPRPTNHKVLVKQIIFRTGVTFTESFAPGFSSPEAPWRAGGINYSGAQCHRDYMPHPTPSNHTFDPTHEVDSIAIRNHRNETSDVFGDSECSGYRWNQPGTFNTTNMQVCLDTNQILTAVPHIYPYNPSLGSPSGRRFNTVEMIAGGSGAFGFFRTAPGTQGHTVTQRYRKCSDPPMTLADWPYTQELYPVFQPTGNTFREDALDPTTWTATYPSNREQKVTKEGTQFTQEIDVSLQPPGGDPTDSDTWTQNITRATWNFELFDVVAVRVRKNG